MGVDFCFFFFSSRRRHTRSLCDWSSDVCSSDLAPPARLHQERVRSLRLPGGGQDSSGVAREPAARWSQARDHGARSEEHTSELQSHSDLVCRLLLEKKKKTKKAITHSKKHRRYD